MIKDSPVFGKGVRGFRWLCFKTDKYKNIDNSGCSTHPHHTYLQNFSFNRNFWSNDVFIFIFLYFKNLL